MRRFVRIKTHAVSKASSSRMKNIGNAFELSGVAFRLAPHMVSFLLSYRVGSKSVSECPPVRPFVRPSDPDTMTNTALEATTSSSGRHEEDETERLSQGASTAKSQ